MLQAGGNDTNEKVILYTKTPRLESGAGGSFYYEDI